MTDRGEMADRRLDRFVYCVIAALLINVVVTMYAAAMQAPAVVPALSSSQVEQQIETAKLREHAASGDKRLDAIEALKIEARLAVLEKGAERSAKIEILAWGTLITMMGSLLLRLVELRRDSDTRRRRSS